MNKLYLFATTLFAPLLSSAQIELKHLASFSTGVKDAAETVAFDVKSKKAFLTNSSTNNFTIVDIQNPSLPLLVKNVDLSPYGAGPNSIATNGLLISVAMEATVKTDSGKIAFFDIDGTFLRSMTVGALPDMILFNKNGNKLFVANEGEPNDSYSVDPEGSVSIIDIPTFSVSHISFSSFNNQRLSLLNKGVRIFGNNGLSTVSQDLEPEYITLSPDEKYAYVSMQENNALAIIDLSNNTIKDIQALGFKNHATGSPILQKITLNKNLNTWPLLGTPVYDGGQAPVQLGGFSGLFLDEKQSNQSEYSFYTIPDRGPNNDPVTVTGALNALRPYKLPNYQAEVVNIAVYPGKDSSRIVSRIPLFRKDGTTPISGRSNIPGADEVPVTYSDVNTAFDKVNYTDSKGEIYHELPYDEMGGDFEGLIIDKKGNFWMCDENRPALYSFNKQGVMIERYVPQGTSVSGKTPQAVGTYGLETLPARYAKRRANRGFEAIAYDSSKHIIYGFVQSPLEFPTSAVRNKTDIIRIIGIDGNNGNPVSEYIYLLESNKNSYFSVDRVDKIGDAAYKGNGKFVVLERDAAAPNDLNGKKFVFEIDINKATNILDSSYASADGSATKSLEQMSDMELMNLGIRPVRKTKILNLPSIGYSSSDKPEGIAMIGDSAFAVLNDNDFGLAGAGLSDASELGIISFGKNYGLDASDKDSKTNIQNYNVLGMYMPDAISSFSIDGKNYTITANEGDSRDYSGYSEETRVGSLTLDSTYYPDYKNLKNAAQLGRLKTTKANGDYDKDGKYEQIYSFGARSFSIFDQYGNLVYDSGDDFAQQIIKAEPDLFNQDNGTKDGRSDDKGCEPEAITVGEINGNTYAFIGTERQNTILVYDISDPKSPEFITYYTQKGAKPDVSPEIIKFIPSVDSPNAKDMLLVGYEVSGTMGIIKVGDEITQISEEVKNNSFEIHPSPVANSQEIHFDKELSGEIYNAIGELVLSFKTTKTLKINTLEQGIYIVKTKNNGAKRFLVLN